MANTMHTRIGTMFSALRRYRVRAALGLVALLLAAAPTALAQDRFASQIPDQTLYVGVEFSITLPLFLTQYSNSYSIIGTLPPGISFSGSSRVLSGTPTATSSPATFTYRAYDNNTYAVNTQTFRITVLPKPDILPSKLRVGLTEGGSSETYAVALGRQPSGAVTVSLASSDPGAVASTPATLVFAAASYSTAQMVTLLAVQDADGANEEAAITHTASGGGLDGATTTVAATVADDDQGIVLTPNPLTVDEGVRTSYTVTLAAAPSGNVTVTYIDDAVTHSFALTPATWNTGHTVAVYKPLNTATGINSRGTIRHTATGGGYTGAVGFLTEIYRDAHHGGIIVSPTTLALTEGGSAATYSVRMGQEPTVTDVVVAVTSSDPDAATTTPASLTFTSGTWNTNQMVTVTPVSDVDGRDESLTIDHLASGGGAWGVATSVAVTVADDDAAGAGVTITPTTLSLAEGASSSYTVALTAAPASWATVTPRISSDTGVVAASSVPLRFSSSTYNVAQTITVYAVEDRIARVGNAASATISHTVGGYYGLDAPSVSIAVADNDRATIDIGPLSASFVEGDVRTYRVTLGSSPTGRVTVLAKDVPAGIGISREPFVFLPFTEDRVISRPITVVDDDIAQGGSRTYRISFQAGGTNAPEYAGATPMSSTGNDYISAIASDNDTASVTVSPTALALAEGGTGIYAVRLGSEPVADVRIAISAAPAKATSSPAALRFSSSTWDVAQTVTVTALHDADGGDDSVVFSHAASSTDAVYQGISIGSVTAAITDDDEAGVLIAPRSLAIVENGEAAYGVSLATMPAGSVTITATRTGDGSVSVHPSALTFASSVWSTVQSVTVRAADDTDPLPGTASIGHAATSSDAAYGFADAGSVAVSVTDDDLAMPDLALSPASIAEAGGMSTVTASLPSATSSADIVLTVNVPADSGVALSANAQLTIAAGATSSSGTVTLTAQDNDIDAADAAVSITAAATTTGTAPINDPAAVTLTIIDDDTRGLALSTSTVSVAEAGGTENFTVVLTSEPTAAVAVAAASSDTSTVSVSASLMFTATNWSVAQTVTATGVDDAVDNFAPRAATLTLTASGGDYGSETATVSASATNDDDAAGVTIAPLALTVPEGGTSTYAVSIHSQPAAGETVIVSTSGITGDSSILIFPVRLTFTAENWSAQQTATVSALEDTDRVAGTATIAEIVRSNLSPSSAYAGLTLPSVVVTELENDAQVQLHPTAADAHIAENGGMVAITATLTAPSATQTVATVYAGFSSPLSLADGVDYALSANRKLTIAAGETESTGSVTVTGIDNEVDDSDRLLQFYFTIDNTLVERDTSAVRVWLTDDDTAEVVVSVSSVTISEAGGRGEYALRLASDPAGTVTVMPSTQSAAVALSTTTLHFTSDDWEIGQTLTVTGIDDDVDNGASRTAYIGHAISGATGNYDSTTPVDTTTVTVVDDDTAAVRLSATQVTVPEGGTTTYTIVLATEPPLSVYVTSVIAGDADITLLNSSSLLFTQTNWSMAQTVALMAGEDEDDTNGSATISHSAVSVDPIYNSISVASVTATEADNERPTPTLALTPSSISEASGASTVTASLSGGTSTANIVLEVSVPANSGVSLSANAKLTIGANATASVGTVTLTALDNSVDAADATVSITASATTTDPRGVGTPEAVTLTITDDDTRGIELSTSSVSVAEAGDTVAYRLRLRSQPTATVGVAAGSTLSSAAVSSAASPLSFTAQNWSVWQTATVTGVPDDVDNAGGKRDATINHSASGGDYSSETAALAVAVLDDDMAGVTISPLALTVPEGSSSSTYAVVLQSQPASGETVTIAVSASGDGSISASPASLAFTAADWSAEKMVTVSAADDGDNVAGTASIAHAASSNLAPSSAYAGLTLPSVAVTERENDAEVVLHPSSDAAVPIAEDGGMVAITATLTAPSASQTVATVFVISESPASLVDGVDYALSANRKLTIRPGATSSIGTVTVAGIDNDVDDPFSRAVFLSFTLDNMLVVRNLNWPVLSLIDDDTAGVTIDTTTVAAISEAGGETTYTVRLTSDPAGTVAVTPSTQSAAVSLSTTTLNFTSDNWETAQTVTVTGEDDDVDNGASRTARIGHAVSGSTGNYGGITVAATTTVTVLDDDTAGVRLSATALTVPEGSEAAYTIRLDTMPTGSVTITGTQLGDSDITFANNALTFATDDWSTAQALTLQAAEDEDDINGSVTVYHGSGSSDPNYSGGALAIASLIATEADNERPTPMLALTPSSIAEASGVSTVTASLSGTTSTANIVLEVSVPANSGVSLSANAKLTIGSGATSSIGTVTLTAQDNAIDAPDATVSITASATTTDLRGTAAPPAATLTILDDDTRGLRLSISSADVDEDAGMQTYPVRLESQPTESVTVQLTSDDSTAATVSPPLMTFTAMDWSTAQSATVTGVNDDIDNPLERRTTSLSHAASGGDYGSVTRSLIVTVDDDDTAGIAVPAEPVGVPEGGTSTFAVSLATQPTQAVTLAVSQATGGDSDISVSPSSMTFAADEWNVAQYATLSADEDDTDSLSGTSTIVFTAASSDTKYSGVTARVMAVEQDNERPAAALVLSPSSINENGGMTTVTARLSGAAPTQPVVVTVSASDARVQLSANAKLTIAVGGTASAGVVRITAVDNNIDAADAVVQVMATATTTDPRGVEPPAAATLTIADDDMRGIALSTTTLAVAENGGTADFTVRLTSEPTQQVVLTAASSDAAAATASGPLTFTAQNWSVAQQATATGVDDAVANFAPRPATLTLTAAGGDYAGETAAVSVSVANDGDAAGVAVSPTALTVPEGGSRAYAVVLQSQPASGETVTIAISASGDDDIAPSPASLEFTATNWSTAQMVTASAAEDNNDNVAGTATISHAAGSNLAPSSAYANLAGPSVAVTELENDAEVSLASVATIAENGGVATVTATLTAPSASATVVTVRVSSAVPPSLADGVDYALSANRKLTIAAGTVSSVGTVTVTGIDNAVDDSARGIALYFDMDNTLVRYSQGVSISLIDDDTAGVTFSATSVTLAESDSTTYRVRLDTDPAGLVTVTPSTDSTAVTLAPPALTFSTTTWAAWRTVTVTGDANDVDDGDSRTATISHAVAGATGNYGSNTPASSVQATVTDDDTAALMLSHASRFVPESGEAEYTLKLATRPLAAVTVAVSADASGDADITVAPAAVTFAPAAWNQPQALTLAAAADADALRGRRQIRHSASSSDMGYDGPAATLNAYEIDADAPEVELTLNPEQIAENDGISQVLAELKRGTSTADTIVVVDIANGAGSQAQAAIAAALAMGAPPPSIAAASDFILSDNRRLTIPAGRVRSVGTVTIQARDNDDATPGGALGQVEATVTNNSAIGVNEPQTQLLRVIDDESGDAVLTLPGRLEVVEGGSGVYRVFLTSAPNGPVTVTPDLPADFGLSVTTTPPALTFQSGNYSVQQLVTVTLGDNAVVDAGTRVFSIDHAVAGYGAVTTSTPVAVAVTDNDTAAFLFAPQQVSMAAGTSTTYAVSLATRPRADVAVDIALSPDDPASSIALGSTTRVVFTTTDWNQPQRVALRDDRRGGQLPSQVTVVHRATSADLDYNGLTGSLRAAGPPTFGAASVDDQRYTQGRRIAALALPSASLGVGAISYALAPSLPAGLTFDESTRTVSGTPRSAQASTEYTWSATDAAGATAALTFRIAVTSDSGGGGGGSVDVLTFGTASVPQQFYVRGRAIAPLVLPQATGGEAPVRYAMLSLPAGLAFDPATRTLTGTPTEALESREYRYRATDATGAIATLRIAIAVRDNAVPDFGSAAVPAQSFTVGTPVSLTLPAASGGDGALAYALAPTLPPGLAFNPATRTISGTPTAPAAEAVYTLEATDADGDSAALTLSIEVATADDADTLDTQLRFIRGWRLALPELVKD